MALSTTTSRPADRRFAVCLLADAPGSTPGLVTPEHTRDRAETWAAACRGFARRGGVPGEETAWLTRLARRDCAAAVLALGGGPALPEVHRVARIAWYSALAAAEGCAVRAVGWARRAQRGASALAADSGRALRAGHAYLAWTHARMASAPADAAGWAVLAADAFDGEGDALNAGWAHLAAASALERVGRGEIARAEREAARGALAGLGLFELLCARVAAVGVTRVVEAVPAPTRRQGAVLELLAEGLTAAAIARRMGISVRTVHHHLEQLYRKLGTTDRLSTVLRAEALGLLR